MPPQEGAPPERGERGGELPHRQPAPCGEVDPVHRGGELDEVAGALGQGRRLRRIRGPVVVERTDLLPVHGGVARVRLALHPVDGGEQLPADAGAGGDVAVQVLAPGERRLRAGEERGRDGVRQLGPVPGGPLDARDPRCWRSRDPRRGDDPGAGDNPGDLGGAPPRRRRWPCCSPDRPSRPTSAAGRRRRRRHLAGGDEARDLPAGGRAGPSASRPTPMPTATVRPRAFAVGVADGAGVVACWPVAVGAGDAVTLARRRDAGRKEWRPGWQQAWRAAVAVGVAAGADDAAGPPAVSNWYRLYSFISAMRFAP